ncbi:hypothetical protein AKO1_007660 [Acrasis kona]|uniref:Uncharacterized protein n=1 Tax=Acrasis kona TaxID=1008807 RepID=A0AAW2YQI8_9EUKA
MEVIQTVYETLLPNLSTQQVNSVAKMDFQTDANGKKAISNQLFFDSIFNLSDCFCESWDTSEVSSFVVAVHKTIADVSNKTKAPICKQFHFYNKDSKKHYEAMSTLESVLGGDTSTDPSKSPNSARKKGVSFKSSPRSKPNVSEKHNKQANSVTTIESFGSEKDSEEILNLLNISQQRKRPSSASSGRKSREEEKMLSPVTSAIVKSKDLLDLKTEDVEEIVTPTLEVEPLKRLSRPGSASSISSGVPLVSFGGAQNKKSVININTKGMDYFHKRNNAEHMSRVHTAKPKYMEKAMQKKLPGPVTLEKVILHQMRHSHSSINGEFPKSYVHLSGFIEKGIVNTEDIYGQIPHRRKT